MSIGAILLFFQQFCGINAVQFYLPQVFDKAGSILDKKYSVLISISFMLIATVIGSAIIEKFGRRVLYIVSALGLMISIGGLGVHFLINGNEDTSATTVMMMTTTPATTFDMTTVTSPGPVAAAFSDIYWAPGEEEDKGKLIIPLVCLTLFGIAFSLGVGPICWIIVTEITPPQTLGLIVSTTSAFAWIFTFTVVRYTSSVMEIIGTPATYFGFAGLSFLSAVFIYFLPETKGKTNEELCRVFKYDN